MLDWSDTNHTRTMSLTLSALLGMEPPKKQIVEPISVPLSVRFTPETCDWGLKAGRFVHVRGSDEGPIRVELGDLDAWRVRGDFLQARSPDTMLTFLQTTGVFSRTTESGYWTFDDLMGFQIVIRLLMDKKPLKWRIDMFEDQKLLRACVAHKHFQVEFSWPRPVKTTVARLQNPESHCAALIARTTLSALLATVHVDHLRQADFWFCERKVCGKQFELTGHRKKYCSDPCAHAEAVKAYRLRKKQKK